MQLEKVTARSGHAALAGWISSNDVALFATVLVMSIAIYFAAGLARSKKENSRIQHDKVALSERLEVAAGELNESQDSLKQTLSTLHKTESERNQLQQQLNDKVDAIAGLNARLDAVLLEKGQLELTSRSLAAANELSLREKEELNTQKAALISDRDSWKAKNAHLQARLEDLTSQVESKVAALEQIETERERLKTQADELEVIVGGLKRRLEKSHIELTELKTAAETERKNSHVERNELETELAERDQSIDVYIAKLKQSSEQIADLLTEKQQLEQTISEEESKRQANLIEEGHHYRELVGLTGRMNRVAVLFDASGSMTQARLHGGSDRWVQAQEIAAKWLQHLNVEQCVLIVFSTNVRSFPDDGSLADVSGDGGEAKRNALLQQVKMLTPGGSTNTYEALRKAYEYDVDSILLFTDEAPSRSSTGAFDPAVARQIYGLCQQHPNIPIHTIGLGNYFDQNASTFLLTLAKITDGTFHGK